MDPALPAIGAQHEPVGAALLEQLHLVALVEERELRATELIGDVEQTDEVVADQPPLATVDRSDEPVSEGEPRGVDRVADGVGLARLEERRAAPARQRQLGVVRVRDVGSTCDRVHIVDRDGTTGPVRIAGGRRDGERAGSGMGQDVVGRGGSPSRRRFPNRPNASVAPTMPEVVTRVATRPSGTVGRPPVRRSMPAANAAQVPALPPSLPEPPEPPFGTSPGPLPPSPGPPTTTATSSSLGVGLVVGVGDGLVVGVGDGLVVGVGVGVAVGSPVPTPVRLGRAVERGVGAADLVGRSVGFGVGFGVDLGSGFGVGFGVGLGVGAGVGVGLIVTVPAASWSANRSRLNADRVTG